MKMHLFYLSLPSKEKLYDLFPEKMVDDFNYISPTLNLLTKKTSKTTNNKMYLYAMTNKKEYADIFESLHDMSLFKRIEKKVTTDEYEKMRQENLLSVLDWRTMVDGFTYTEEDEDMILCSKCEVFDLTDTIPNFAEDDMMTSTEMEYEQFKDEYIKALDYLLYCTYNRMGGEDAEYYNYNYSFGCTAEGFVPAGSRIRMKPNHFALYSRLYSLLLRKE